MNPADTAFSSDGPPTFEQIAAYYMAEFRELARICNDSQFEHMLQRFLKYPAFLGKRSRQRSPLLPLLKASNDTRIIDIDTTSSWVHEALFMAHFGACCNLLSGWSMTRAQFSADTLKSMAREHLQKFQTANPAQLNGITVKLHTMDAVRTLQLLRILGLLTRPTGRFRQLALGAGAGLKERLALHMLPTLTIEKNKLGAAYRFSTEQGYVEHVVVVDSHPQHRERYSVLNDQSSPPSLGLVQDTFEALHYLADAIDGGSLAPRNLVTVIRFEHRMIPDTGRFLQRLASTLDKSADLIVSMGAGHTLEDFVSREEKLAEIFKALERVKLKPVLIKLHSTTGTTLERQASLRYGSSSISTYQIMYCRVERKALQRCKVSDS